MTACVNNQNEVKGGVSHKVLRSVVAGVLAVSMVPTAAMADEGTEAAGVDLLAAPGTWADSLTVDYTVDAVGGLYTATVDSNVMAVESVVNAAGEELTAVDYDVYYYKYNNSNAASEWQNKWSLTNATTEQTVNKENGGAPNVVMSSSVDKYAIAIVKAGSDFDFDAAMSAAPTSNGDVVWQEFTIKEAQTDISGATAFEAVVSDSTSDVDGTKLSDDVFKYNGGSLNVAFKVDGEVLDLQDVEIVWTQKPADANVTTVSGKDYVTVVDAGTYTAKITGKGKYTGSVDVSLTVAKIDLAEDNVAIAPVAYGNNATPLRYSNDIVVNGEELAENGFTYGNWTVNGKKSLFTDEMTVELISVDDVALSASNSAKNVGKYAYRIAAAEDSKNVSGETVVYAYVTDAGVSYEYAGQPLASLATMEFGSATGMTFTESAFTAELTGSVSALVGVEPSFKVTVMKDGEVVTDYTQPGHYTGTIETAVTAWKGATYAGFDTFEFDIPGADYSKAKVFATVENDALSSTVGTWTPFGYTGEAVEPKVVVKMGGKDLVEGTDYTVALEKDGEAVESAVEIGKYTLTVTFADVEKSEVEFFFEIGKANIVDVESAQPFYALPADGSAVEPSFVGYTAEEQAFELSADEVSVKYYKLTFVEGSADTDADDTWIIKSDAKALKAEEIDEPGYYVASVSLLTTSKLLQGGEAVKAGDIVIAADGSTKGAVFQASERVAFADVDANAWYAESVYQAAELGYVNGIGGTNLFAPSADIDRAQIAAIMFNMAGGVSDPDKDYPTKFSDVDASAWYAQAVAWASTAGVVNGYDEDTFGTFDKATREQVAAMFYNYAKAMGQDVTVEDEAAALAKVSDADTVSGWAKTAVAWAIENGVMGNGGYIAAQDNITRAEVAAMAVNFQPEKL